jgi:Spy/CpxP family protein refolding chaperone
MRRLLPLVLLVSLGLNAGLAWRLLRDDPAPARTRWEQEGRFRPAPGDTQAWRERMDHRLHRLAERLDLDPQQLEAFRGHRARVEGDLRAQAQLVEAARAALRQEARREPPQPAAVSAALAAVGRAEAALDSLVAANLRTELELLRPDQQARLLRLLPFERLGSRGGFGPGRGDGPGGRHGRRHAPGAAPAPPDSGE